MTTMATGRGAGDRPSAAPGLLAEVVASVPERLRRKLDAEPAAAEGWVWTSGDGVTRVTTPSGEVVVVDGPGPVATAAGLRCTCLLSPRCLHVLCVAAVLPIDDGGHDPGPGPSGTSPRDAVEEPAAPAGGLGGPGPEPAPLTPAQARAAAAALDALADLVSGGVAAAGTTGLAELLRAVQDARSSALPRLSGEALSAAQELRWLREGRDHASLPRLADAVRAAGTTAWVLRTAPLGAGPGWMGIARREYTDLGSLRLLGLFAEPVVAASGHAGCITWFAGPSGRTYSVSDVRPGPEERAAAAYDGGPGYGGVSVSPRQLARSELFVQGATGTGSRRLGGGAGVRAARGGTSALTDPWVVARFTEPWSHQVDRALAAGAGDPGAREAGLDLLFLDLRVGGATRDGLAVTRFHVDEGPRGAAAIPLEAVASPAGHLRRSEDNLGVLASRPGLVVRAIGRLVPGRRAPTVALLAVAPLPSETTPDTGAPPGGLHLPASWGGRACLGYDVLTRGMLPAAGDVGPPNPGGPPEPGEAADPASGPRSGGGTAGVDPLEAARRRWLRFVQGGCSTLPQGVQATVEAEARHLERRLMPAAAGALRGLVAASGPADRGLDGRPRRADPNEVLRAWLALGAILDAAEACFLRRSWGVGAPASGQPREPPHAPRQQP